MLLKEGATAPFFHFGELKFTPMGILLITGEFKNGAVVKFGEGSYYFTKMKSKAIIWLSSNA